MKNRPADKRPNNPRVEVINELLGMARIMRKRGSADKAIIAAQYEQQLEKDLEKAQALAA